MEQCRCDWLHELGHDVAKLQDQDEIIWVVREANLVFNAPAKVFDELEISVRVLQVGKVKLVVEQKIYNKGVLLCQGVIKLATLDKTSFKLTAMPDTLRAAFVALL
jgi:YbgC/YbaW family acyl-CoA thioester hydrolase